MFAKDLTIANLLDFYGEILNEKPRRILEQYYCEDLSLAEIAENEGISRQGVRAVLKHSESSLLLWESKLGLAQRFLQIKALTEEISELSHKISETDNPSSKESAERILALASELKTKL